MPLPDLRLRAFVPALLGACVLALSFAPAAAAAKPKTIPAQLRVVDSTGETLTEQTQYTGDGVAIQTDPKATCFGPGTGGSGDTVEVPGTTALGQLADARTTDRDVRPLSISDAFDFGVALCGIGEAISPDTGFFYLKRNHEASQTGGDGTVVEKGDEILWYLIEDFNAPIPDELVLSAPARAKGSEIPVRVVSYADDGERKPAAGIEVTGADAPTDATGETTVPADADLLELTATGAGAIPSNEVVVCTLALPDCEPGYAETIGGTKGDDRIVGGKLAEAILAAGGDDRIDVSRGGSAPDLIRCGGGEDTVTLARESQAELVGCERIRPRR